MLWLWGNLIKFSSVTEVWDLETGKHKDITPILTSGDYAYGIGLYAVDTDLCTK